MRRDSEMAGNDNFFGRENPHGDEDQRRRDVAFDLGVSFIDLNEACTDSGDCADVFVVMLAARIRAYPEGDQLLMQSERRKMLHIVLASEKPRE